MESTANKTYQVNVTPTSDEVKVFLKIRKVEYTNDKPYYKVSDNKQSITLYDPIRKVHSDKSIDYDEFDKIFTEEENSYVYEEVCRDTVQQALRGTNFCYLGYGLTHTGKKSTLLGKEDSISNINSRGLFFRLLEKLIHETIDTELSVNVSFVAVNKTKYCDLMFNFFGKQVKDYDDKKVVETFKEIKSLDITQLRKLSVSDGDLNGIIHFYNEIIYLFDKLEPYNEILYSRSHFLFFINLVNTSGQIVSKITFCVLAGSEKFTPHPSDKKSDKSSQKFKESIFIQSAFENLKNCMLMLKNPEYQDKIIQIPFDESPLTVCLRNYINSPSTKFRIIGCIQPNTGFYESVKDTLMYLYNCKKSVTGKSSNQKNSKTEVKRDEVLYELENKIKNQEKNIKKLNDTITGLQKKLSDIDTNYKKNLEVIKTAFNFDGDINKLSLNDESIKESRYARSIRDSMDMVRYLKGKIVDLEKKIEDLKEENKKVVLEKRIIENDKAMVTLFTKYKEDNLHEENVRKIALTHSKDLENLKNENEILKKQIELYRKETEDKIKFVHNLPNVLKDNIDDKKKNALKTSEIINEMDSKYKKSLKESQINVKNELKYNAQSYEGIINLKNEEIENYKNENSVFKNKLEKEPKKYVDESLKILKNLQDLIQNYKKNFDMRKIGTNVNSINSFPKFLKAKEDFDKVLENVSSNCIRTSLPLTFAAMDDKKNSKFMTNPYASNENFFSNSSTNFNPVKVNSQGNIQNQINININMKNYDKKDVTLSASDISEEAEQINPSHKIYTVENLENYEKNDLYKIIFDIQNKFEMYDKFYERIKKEKRGNTHKRNSVDSQSDGMNKLFAENEKLRRKLDEQIKINNSHKIYLQSQERLIEKLSAQNMINCKTKVNPGGKTDMSAHSTVFTAASPRTQSANSKSSNFKFRPQTGR